MDAQAKPCPFCGLPAVVADSYGGRSKNAWCNNGYCSIAGEAMSLTAWNTRPGEDALQAELQKQRQANRQLWRYVVLMGCADCGLCAE